MKAAFCTAYGPPSVIQIQDIPKPKPTPKPGELLIRVHATCVNSGDWRIRSLKVPAGMGLVVRVMFGLIRPRHPVLGTDLAGVVEAVGDGVTAFSVGDEVFGATEGVKTGTHAEYVVLPEHGAVAKKPSNLSMAESASLLFGGLTAVSFLQRFTHLQPTDRILINGASGSVGCAAVQLAKHIGAHVTAVCSGANADLVRSLGADKVIDYTQADFLNTGEVFDVIMDNVGNAPWDKSKKVLSDTGRLLAIVGGLPDMVKAGFVSRKSGRQLINGVAETDAEAVSYIAELASAGNLKPIIDSTYSFENIIEAHKRVDSGRKRGSVVVSVSDKS